jgi:hypothetical protein
MSAARWLVKCSHLPLGGFANCYSIAGNPQMDADKRRWLAIKAIEGRICLRPSAFICG